MEANQYEVAKKAFMKTRNLQYLELILNIEVRSFYDFALNTYIALTVFNSFLLYVVTFAKKEILMLALLS